MASKERSSILHSWYHSLTTRNVDLIGDFAGSNLGAIEGDSLLLECFSDPELDFRQGLQLLHAVFLLERFLKRLHDRRCNYVIIFIQQHRGLCVPFNARQEDGPKFLFAREVIIRHLKAYIEPTSNVKIWSYPRMDDLALQKRLRAERVYFILCHDGAFRGVQDSIENFQRQDALRGTIHYTMSQGFYVGLVNDLRWQDSKVMVEIIDNDRKTRGSPVELGKAVQEGWRFSGESCQKLLTTNIKSNNSPQVPDLFQKEEARPSYSVHLVCHAIAVLRGSSSSDLLSRSFLLHHLFLREMDIVSRRVDILSCGTEFHSGSLVAEFLIKAVQVVTLLLAKGVFDLKGYSCDLADMIDGRVFTMCFTYYGTLIRQIPSQLRNLHAHLCDKLGIDITDTQDNFHLHGLSTEKTKLRDGPIAKRNAVLPFSNAIFEPHLRHIQLEVTGTGVEDLPGIRHVFQDLTHWHNHKKQILQKTPAPLTKRLDRQSKRNATEMRNYAASLTNASGKVLSRHVIVSSKTSSSKSSGLRGGDEPKKQSHAGHAFSSKSSTKGSPKPKLTTKETLLESIGSEKKAKALDEQQKFLNEWKIMVNRMKGSKDFEEVETTARQYFSGLKQPRTDVLKNEIFLYRIGNLLRLWQQKSMGSPANEGFQSLALATYLLESLSSSTLTPTEASCASQVAKYLSIPMTFRATSDAKRKLSFDFDIRSIKAKLSIPWQSFVLLQYGPYMRRDLDSKQDSRVPFEPDGWQREVLDQLDANNSVFVVAPTSSGKTFISFYAMEKVLREDDEGILVYIAPTKALVNQIAAEIEARFAKNYSKAGKTVWAIHTRDHRVHNPAKCQILVTVPHILQIMLLSPENAQSWSPKIKRIIFDEIHTIGRAEDGLVWEQLLLLSPCPIIALSATVGNPDDFCSWLASTQESNGIQLTMIQHPHRYSDLRKFKYVPPQLFAFCSVPQPISELQMSVDDDPCFGFIHPISTLLNQTQLPEDLSLEPRDCLVLYEALSKHQNDKFPVPAVLSPRKALPNVPRKHDIFLWEISLKSLVREWMKTPESPFQELLVTLSRTMNPNRQAEYRAGKVQEGVESTPESINDEDMFQTTMPLLCSLQSQNALPAILFNYDRSKCEELCKHILEMLELAETKFKTTSPSWLRDLQKWKSHLKAAEQREKKSGNQKKGGKGKGIADDEGQMSKIDHLKEEEELKAASQWDFDPEAPLDRFSFADRKKAGKWELGEFGAKLRRRNVDSSLIEALRRGIAVHHAGCNRAYRHTVEMLFRRGFIRVVFATGTLALGINMPCVTTVFCGDSVFLTALEYRQASGRAGRRGFDLLGNVIFHHIDENKICRLISSRLPDLSGHFPLTTSLVLRLFSLLHNSSNCEFAAQGVHSLLSQPRIYLGGEDYRHQVLHHLRFSIEYLRRNSLLSLEGTPQNFAGIVCHLYYTENAAFSFHALLRQGYFHELALNVTWNRELVLENLMLVLARIFGRRRFRTVTEELKHRPKKSPSIIFLPPLPSEASQILSAHDVQTKEIFENYVATFIDQHMQNVKDNVLPFSGLKIGGEANYLPALPATKIRSAFTALSGHGDSFATVSELCKSVRSGVFLEEAVIPKLSGNLEVGEEEPLNAYLYDFWKHQDLRALAQDNGIRTSDVWFALNDFSLVLATIVTSLTSLVKGPISDLDFLDLQGGGDVGEIELDAASDDEEGLSEPPSQTKKVLEVRPPRKEKKKKKKIVEESWEDEADEQEEKEEEDKKASAVEDSGTDQKDDDALPTQNNEGDLKRVLLTFQLLKADFDEKFHKMWA